MQTDRPELESCLCQFADYKLCNLHKLYNSLESQLPHL